jgi:hypothetical protein
MVALEGVARRTCEVQICGLDAVRTPIRWNEPEDGVGARECCVDDFDVTMRSLYDFDALAGVR